jgi:thiamine-phosphate pyrophosphorylase
MTVPRFYPIVDSLEAADAVLQAGAEIVQWRHKGPLTRQAFDTAAAIADLCRGVPLVVNDRADVAVLLGAMLHLGQDDLPPVLARQMVYMIGLSTHNAEQMEAANEEPVVYHALGPIFPTTSKANPDPVVGLDGLRAIVPLSKRPVVAIGGITFETAASVIEAGADSVAVISALQQGDVQRTARAWIQHLR